MPTSMTVLDAPAGGALTTRPHRVTAVRRETGDVVSLDVEPEAGVPAAFAPGQFDMVYAFGVGEAALSISSDAAVVGPRTYTVRSVGWVTRALHQLQPGSSIGVRGPFGRGWPVADVDGEDLLVLAGGIGLAPVRPAVLHALRHRERFGRVVLLVGARTPGDLVFRDDLARWEADPAIDVHVTVDLPSRGWSGPVGVVTRLLSRIALDGAATRALTCGPEVMMWFVARALLARGLPPEAVFVTLERNMRCAVGTCGHCQLGPEFVCRDGPVFAWSEAGRLLAVREL
jgi:NAD(P)H-flavin reductase